MQEAPQEELVDLVDANGVIQKEGVLRSLVHQYTKLHLQIVIAVIFNSSGQILVHQRALTKPVNPGDIDHTCGGVKTGETPIEAALREAKEETGTIPTDLKVILKGINSYNRYRYLLVGRSDDPTIPNPEAEWIKYINPEELQVKRDSGEMTFVDEFFEDLDLAIQNRPKLH